MNVYPSYSGDFSSFLCCLMHLFLCFYPAYAGPELFYDFEFGLLGFSLISKSSIVLLCVLYFSMTNNVLLLFYMS
jgi:hypothetical protein